MNYIQHNSFTALQTLASVLNDELSNFANYYNLTELESFKNKTNKVAIIDTTSLTLQDYINSLKSNPNIIYPKIIIARGNTIRTDNISQLHFQNVEILELINENDENDKIMLDGSFFNYEVDLQFILLNSNRYVSNELQLELKRIINTKLKEINYKLRVKDTNNPTALYVCEDYGQVVLRGFETAPFENQADYELGLNAVYITGLMEESYFKLSSSDVYKIYEIEGMPL
jgi:hypothetical protein